MNLTLLPNRILVEEVKEEGTIEVVNVQKGAFTRGRIVNIASAWTSLVEERGITRGFYGLSDQSIGRVVHFAKHAGEEIEYEGKKYRVLFVSADREGEVLAIEN